MKAFLASLLLAFMVGCASMGIAPVPTTFQGKVDYARSQTNAALATCTDLVDRNRMSDTDGQKCSEMGATAKKALDAAESLGEMNGGADQLLAVQQTLLLLETYLAEKAK